LAKGKKQETTGNRQQGNKPISLINQLTN